MADYDSVYDSVAEVQPEPKEEVDQRDLTPVDQDDEEESNTKFKFGSWNDPNKEPSEESDGRIIINIGMDEFDESNEASNNGMNNRNITYVYF